MRRALTAALLAALLVPAAAFAAADVRDVDLGQFPVVRVTAVATSPSAVPPDVQEAGRPVAGLTATNLGDSKSLVLCIDRSRSMGLTGLRQASDAARAFIAAKPAGDRIGVCTFGEKAIALTGFSTATIDADLALRTLQLDETKGTALYDAVALASRSLSAEENPARVVLVLTDGADFGSQAGFDEALAAAKNAGVAVYVIGIESADVAVDLMKRLSGETGGAYYGAASTAALEQVYAEIAEELRRTWLLEYVTAARPGDRLALEVRFPGGETAQRTFVAPGEPVAATHPEPSPLVPKSLLTSSWSALAIGGLVGFVILVAAALALTAPKGSWLRGRLAPHVSSQKRAAKSAAEKERLALASGLFQATERAFGNLKPWKALTRKLEQSDVPLRTPEFVWIMTGTSLLVGLVAALLGWPTVAILAGFGIGGFLPLGVISFIARRRLKAFEDQLPDILVTMAASLKAGHSFRQGLQTVVDEGQEPASKEFKRVLTETRLGRPMDDALADMAERLASKNFEFVMSAVTIQRQVGGSLASLFDMVADTVRQRQQFRRKIKALTAMGRASAYVLVGLPFLVAGAITLINPSYMEPLWHSSTGHKLVIGMLVMMAVGSAFLKKIVSFKG